jgi:hypothetical protein
VILAWLVVVGGALAEPPPAAIRLQSAGEQEAAAGRWDIAGRYFGQAHRNAPDWKAPLTALGRVSLETGALTMALQWFDALGALPEDRDRMGAALSECVRRELALTVPHGVCRQYFYARIESDERRRAALESVLSLAPELAPGWADLVALIEDPASRHAAIDRGLAANPDSLSWGVLAAQRQALLLGN